MKTTGDTIQFSISEDMDWLGHVESFPNGTEFTVVGDDPGRVFGGKTPIFRVWWNGVKLHLEGERWC